MRRGMTQKTIRKIIFGVSGGVSFLLSIVLLLIANHLGKSLADQNMAKRWSEKGGVAQVSCYFSPNAYVTADFLQEFEHSLDGILQEASIDLESDNPSARLWADTYSADGKVTVSSDRASVDADAIGIGGDFFLFHPVKLLYGSYFSGNDLNHDYCIIDRDAAWQLFGSSDVAGMMVYIGGQPHIVTGVIEREDGRLAKAAGLDGTLVYVSYETLAAYGSCNGINHYEIIMPDPVDNFALNKVRERLATNPKEVEVLENTSRFSLLNRLKWVGSFGTRSMNGKAIIFPYWENIARGYEDIIGVLTLFMMIFFLYALVVGLIFLGSWWKHKKWTVKDVYLFVKDKIERRIEKFRYERKRGRRRK